MKDNNNNFSSHILTNFEFNQENLDELLGTSVTFLNGCNGAITSTQQQCLYLFIPTSEIDNICKISKKSFEEILDEISKFNFKFEILHSNSVNSYTYYNTRKKINEAVIVKLNLKDYRNSKHRYYAFCMFRHFYYSQSVLLKYLEIVNKEDSESDRIKKLSYSSIGCSGYTFIPALVVDDVTVDTVITNFLKKGNNTITNFGMYYVFNNGISYENAVKTIIDLKNTLYRIAEPENVFILRNINSSKLLAIDDFKKYKIGDKTVNTITINQNTGSWDEYYCYNLPQELYKYLIKVERKLSDTRSGSIVRYDNSYPIETKNNVILDGSKQLNKCFTFNIKQYLEDVDKTKKRYDVDIKSRHPSHRIFRKALESVSRVLIRLGSTTKATKEYDIVLNSVIAIENSSSKLAMKRCFIANKVLTPEYVYQKDTKGVVEALKGSNIEYPIIAKHIMGSRGTGNYKLDSETELLRWSKSRNIENYIFEKFKNFAKEYRIHVSTEGVFLMWRKLRRNDTPANQKWFFNNINCNWISESNNLFDAPINIKDIQKECIKALKSVGLDFGACDVRVQKNENKDGEKRKNSAPEFSIIEINSAPSMAEVTSSYYLKEFVKLIDKKRNICAG